MKVKQMNKTVLKQLRVDMNVALRAVGEKYGLHIHVGSASYQPNEATWKLKTSILGANGENKQAKEDFISYGQHRGFDKDDFGATFVVSGEEFRIIGWLPRRRKYPIQAVNTRTGKTFIFPVNTVLRALGKSEKVQPSCVHPPNFNLRG